LTIQRSSLKDVQFRAAPNRRIAELFSANASGAQGVTFRIVDMVPASEQEPRHPHCHVTFEETMLVLNGAGRLWTEDGLVEMKVGDALLVPAGLFHLVMNATDEPLRLACFFPVADGVGIDQQERTDILLEPRRIVDEIRKSSR
jgi:quercetin dioxygenase-like cupin family protein